MDNLNSPIDRVLEILGGPTKAARALGIENPSVVINWRTRGQIPVDRVIAIESLTGIPREQLRPDLAGIFVRTNEDAA